MPSASRKVSKAFSKNPESARTVRKFHPLCGTGGTAGTGGTGIGPHGAQIPPAGSNARASVRNAVTPQAVQLLPLLR